MDKIERIGRIIRLIGAAPGITLSQLHNALAQEGIDVTERTVAKDILQLKHVYKLLPDKERLREGYVLTGMYSLSSAEVSLVLDAMHVFGVHMNDSEAKLLKDRLSRIATASGDTGTRRIKRTMRQRDIYLDDTKGAKTQQTLLQAIRARLPVSMEYRTPRFKEARSLNEYPLFLVFHERGWYCLCKDNKRNEYHPRRIDRIIQSAVNERAVVNEMHDDDLNTAQVLMSSGWGMTFPRSLSEYAKAEQQPELIVRFDSSIASYIMESSKRHPNGKLSRTRDGTGDVELRIRLADPREFVFWVQSFGAKALFVAPNALVDQQKSEIKRMAKIYGMHCQ